MRNDLPPPRDRDDWKGRLEWYKGGNIGSVPPLLTVLIGLVLVIGLLLLTGWLLS